MAARVRAATPIRHSIREEALGFDDALIFLPVDAGQLLPGQVICMPRYRIALVCSCRNNLCFLKFQLNVVQQ